MSSKLTDVEFVKDHNSYAKGDTASVDGVSAYQLVKLGVAERTGGAPVEEPDDVKAARAAVEAQVATQSGPSVTDPGAPSPVLQNVDVVAPSVGADVNTPEDKVSDKPKR